MSPTLNNHGSRDPLKAACAEASEAEATEAAEATDAEETDWTDATEALDAAAIDAADTELEATNATHAWLKQMGWPISKASHLKPWLICASWVELRPDLAVRTAHVSPTLMR